MANIKTRIDNKRKLDSEVQEKGKKAKKKVDGPPTDKFKDLQKKYDLLLDEHKKNVQLIKRLHEDINILKKEKPVKKDQMTKESQTTFKKEKDSEIQFPCKECIFTGNCEDEVRWHMTDSHDYPSPDCYGKDSCLVCGKLFDSKSQIMIHRKESHPDLVKPCNYFMEGKCTFDDSVCWYSHKNIKPAVQKKFDCRFCDKSFKRKEEFMTHRKSEHENFIPPCREDQKDSCRFTEKECWYKHKPEEKTINYEYDEMGYPYIPNTTVSYTHLTLPTKRIV